MDRGKRMAALFDFDGVVMDTEPQYTIFWNEQGKKYLGKEDYGRIVKGQTLERIFDCYFAGMHDVHRQITADLDTYEEAMKYEYIPGVKAFLTDLRKNGVKTALVTSSNEKKMAIVYRVHPGMKELFDEILTAEKFTRSKPHPECFLRAMELLNVAPENSVVFEDSFHGLQAGRESGAFVVGVATTNPRESIEEKAGYVLDDYTGMTFQQLLSLSGNV